MSIRNIKSSSNVGALTINGVPYTLARSDVFYYLKFIDYTKELFKAASNLTAKPTVVFYTEDATNKVILDYSLANTTDKTYLSGFFANLTQTSTFNLTNAGYLDKSELEANIGCTLTFSEYKENKVFATVTGVIDLNAALDVYFADYFTDSPQLSKAGSLGTNPTTLDYALVSVNPSTSRPLSSLGLIVGDVIEVVNSDSVNNQFKFEISETTTINQQEVLRLKPIFNDQVPTIESLLGTSSLVNLYVKGTSTQTPVLSGDLGCCYSGNTKLQDNTSYQCSIRGSDYSFFAGSCTNLSVNTIPTVIPSSSSNIISDGIVPDVTFASYIDYTTTTPTVKFIPSKNNLNVIQNNTITFYPNTTYAFSQLDGSNLNSVIRFSTSSDTFTSYCNGIYGAQKATGIGSFCYIRYSSTIPELYIFLEKRKTVNGEIILEYVNTNYTLKIS